METKSQYITLENLEVYKLARELSDIAWKIYSSMDWQVKKVIGDQFITATDSVGANIAEGYGRYHYLDKIKFFYNARASLMECNNHWMSLLSDRKFVDVEKSDQFKQISESLHHKLNIFISSIYKAKDRE